MCLTLFSGFRLCSGVLLVEFEAVGFAGPRDYHGADAADLAIDPRARSVDLSPILEESGNHPLPHLAVEDLALASTFRTFGEGPFVEVKEKINPSKIFVEATVFHKPWR